MLKIYNTLTKQKEEFKPIDPPNVSMYVCGPTVYDFFHIGNARSFISSDIIRKYLEYKGYNVKFVMNLTDVDDKIIKKSIEEKTGTEQVAEKYIGAFFQDIGKLTVAKADIYPKATGHMQDIIDMIKELEQKGFAYNVDGNVFYDVAKFKGYGKLSGKKIDELEAGARIEKNEEKKNPLDFSLWKKAKEGEPYWDSPWGKGRPGWHIECSVMSSKHLGKTFDIHAGGNDLIFPHHENEIAQSEAANEQPFVKYWLHFGFLNIDNTKMSKSLGNFFTARDILTKYSAEAIRLFFAQAYYRGPLNFNDELLAAAEKGLEKLGNLTDTINQELSKNITEGVTPELDIKQFEDKIIAAMDDDFNTAQAIAVIFDFTKEVNRIIAKSASGGENINAEFYKNVKAFLERTAVGIFGIMNFNADDNLSGAGIDVEHIQQMIDKRLEAKNEKNYALADKIREELKELGVELKDSKEGTTFKVVK
ncbi:cysteine--tRNA ligase [bacterium BMS3Abin03]|nr:cysteine--tRNA ligase [bacterium BMS3Abin03]MCG6960668.1 cysteine--tRNA ligase [bacterium BMS3Abin03]